ncbi:MAG: hypothetical protein ACJ8CR_02365 [Roseiflexaceae bacterium]
MALHEPNAVCTVCGNSYWVKPSTLAESRFCSRACQDIGRRKGEISKADLARLYYGEKLSMQGIADKLGWRPDKVQYWMDQYGFKRRSWSEATYVKRNPNGDPFEIRMPETVEEWTLFGLGIGLYMGEGSRKSLHQVAMANTNPAILRIFLVFLEKFCGINRSDFKAWINIFDDCDVESAIQWWSAELNLSRRQFYETATRKSRGGSYIKKSEHGTLSISFLNVKLKKIIDGWCSEYYSKSFTLD